MKCLRCGTETPRLTPTQRYCPLCAADVAAREAGVPGPAFTPRWRREAKAADKTGAVLVR
jgi:hypothetical protein